MPSFTRVPTGVGIGAALAGLAAVIFGIVWMTAVFPGFEKIPADLDRTVELEGKYTFVDEPFVASLLGNATLSSLLASPESLAGLANPAALGIIMSPALPGLVGDPALLAVLQAPNALQSLGNPALKGLLSNPDIVEALADPNLLLALSDPAGLLLLAGHPVLGPLLTDPDFIEIIQDPTFLGLLESGVLVTLVTQPALMELIAEPALGPLLADPAVQRLLADPQALALVLDPRTVQLMASPADLPTVTLPVLLHRERRATGTDADQLFMNEQVTIFDPDTGTSISRPEQLFQPTDINLIVDRSSKEYLPGPDHQRTGYWGLPFHVDKDRIYGAYVSAAGGPLDAAFDGTEDILGLETYRYVVDEESVPLGVNDPLGLPLVVDAAITVWVEPTTGAGVKAVDVETVSALTPSGKAMRFKADLVYTDDTVANLVDDAADARSSILLLGTYMPWAFIVVGLVLGGAGAYVWLARRKVTATA